MFVYPTMFCIQVYLTLLKRDYIIKKNDMQHMLIVTLVKHYRSQKYSSSFEAYAKLVKYLRLVFLTLWLGKLAHSEMNLSNKLHSRSL